MKPRNFSIISSFSVVVIILAVLVAAPVYCEQKVYPTKTIKLMCPYGPGGATDLASRVLASTIPEFVGQPVVVINRPGGSGSVCFEYVRKSKPDGYTMMMTAIGQVALYPAMNTKLPFRYDNLVYVARTQINPNMLVVNVKSPWKTFKDFMKALKKDPGKYKYSTAGLGAVTHLGPSLMLKGIGLKITDATPIHYDSDGDAVMATVRGETHFYQGNLSAIVSSLKGGLVRALAVTTPKRVKGFDNIPTYTELGYPKVDIVGWRGVAGPPGLPDYIARHWEEAVRKTCKSKAWNKLVQRLGDKPGYMNAKDATNFLHKEFKKYRILFTELGLLIK